MSYPFHLRGSTALGSVELNSFAGTFAPSQSHSALGDERMKSLHIPSFHFS